MNNEQDQQQLALPGVLDTMGIDMQELIDEYNLSKSYVQQYTHDFQQLDTLVDGVPLDENDDTPFVGDTTLAGLVRTIPRQALQQLPVFSCIVNGTKNSIPALACSFLLKKFAFNEDTFGKGLLSTLQIGAEQALTHGYAPFMVATGIMYNDFGTTLRLLHFSDTSPEPGITDSNESGYHYAVANLTPTRLKKILKAAQNNPNTSWNVPALERLLEGKPRAKNYSQYQSAPSQNKAGEDAGPTYEIATRYETGQGGAFVTFSPEMSEAPLRIIESKSKWGYPRVLYLVIDPAALNPFGISRVRLASPNQNLMNIYYGNIAAMLLINSAPPIFKRGRFTKPVQLKRNAVWETNDPNAAADLKNLDNGALEQFVSFAQQFTGQIMNMMGTPVNTSGVNTGSASGFSKTAPGVKQQQQVMDLSNNQITKILENFLRQYALVALDTLLSEQTGIDNIIVDDETKNAINDVARSQFVPTPEKPQFIPPIGDDNKLLMNWQRFYQAIEDWSVEVSVSLSKDELKDEKRKDLQDMLVVLAQNAQELGPEAVQKVKEITDMLMQDQAPLVKPLSLTPGAPISAVTAPAPSSPTPTPAATPAPAPAQPPAPSAPTT